MVLTVACGVLDLRPRLGGERTRVLLPRSLAGVNCGLPNWNAVDKHQKWWLKVFSDEGGHTMAAQAYKGRLGVSESCALANNTIKQGRSH